MPRIQFFQHSLKKHILSKQIKFEDIGDIEGIILLKEQSSLPQGYIFIGEEDTVQHLLKTTEIKYPTTIFIAGSRKDFLPTFTQKQPINYIITDLDIIDLYNKTNKIVSNYKYWTSALLKALCEGKNLHQIIILASNMIKAPIYLLNAGFKVICSNTEKQIDDIYEKEISENGYLSFDSINSISLDTSLKIYSNVRLYTYPSQATDSTYYRCEISSENNVIANLLIIVNQGHSYIDMPDLILHLSNIIKKFLLDEYGDAFHQDTICSTFIKDIIEQKIVDLNDIESRSKMLPYPIKGFLYCILIRFDEEGKKKKIPFSYIISQLEEIFEETNITVYKDEIYILHCQDERTFSDLCFDYEQLSTLLVRYNAYAGISNGSRHLNKIYTMYMLSANAIRLGVPFRRVDRNPRIFNYEDYSIYYLIDLCVQKFTQLHNHDDIIYLTHPSIIAICRYDKKHKTNLCDVLFHYLINDRSIMLTAQALYMHRNTVQNKINKISEIITIPLDNGYMQQRMIISYYIMKYYEIYMNSALKL
jgi:hypothetical protein